MGQVLPLPSRIPRPNAKQLEKLHALGIKPDLEETEENKKETRLCKYVRYTLPEGWKMVDNSWREDLPDFYIVDSTLKGRVHISGAWKGSYDNELRLYVLDEPKILELRNEPLIPSETSDSALVVKFAEVFDPLQRKGEQLRAERQEEYRP